MIEINGRSSTRRGFIAMVALIMLVIFAILGVAYWLSSRMSTDMIFAESQRIKARNFAQAALEKVKINITNQYNMNNHDLEYPPRYTNDRVTKEYNIQFADGEFKVVSVKPYEQGGRRFYNVAHHSKGVKIGNYDIWEVTTHGVAKATGITAELRALVKIYRDQVVY